MTPVTDPNILAQLNGSGPKPVTDPDLLSQLNGGEKSSGGFMSAAADFVKSIPGGLFRGATSAPNTSTMFTGSPMEAELERTAPERTEPLAAAQASMHQPEGRAGRFGQAVGEGLGNPASYIGAGSLPLKVGGSILSSVGGEAGGQAAEGTKFEIPARIAGSLAGGVAAVKTLAPSAPKAAVPTYRELKGAATKDYNAAQASGLELHPQGTSAFASRLQQELESNPKHAFTDRDAPKTFAELQSLQNPPSGAVAVTASNLDTLRTKLGRYARETSEGKPTQEAAAASAALGYYNKYLENLPPSHVLAGDAAEYVRATKQGNANYSAAQRVRNFDLKIARAENNAAGGIATSIDNQLKSQARTILNNPRAQIGLKPEEIAAIDELNKGTITSNTLRQLGRGGAGVIPLAMHAATAASTGGASIVPQAILAAGLYGARKTAEGMTKSKAREVAEMLAKRSPEYERRASSIQPLDTSPHRAAIVRALLAH